ncbi:MAG: ABC transporter permease [Patescibacteria group bacterium]|nr:ABC transporter permease [Patescibacteria group bacterium]
MIWTSIKRICKSGFINFWRNGFVSFASVLVVVMSLFVFEALIFFSILGGVYINQIKDKVDVNVYFATNASEQDVLVLKKSIESLPEVAKVEYVSRDQSLIDFKARHSDDELTIQGLNELGLNPFPAALNIKAKDTSQYGSVAKFLESKNALTKNGSTIIESINYNKNKLIIDRLIKILDSLNKLGVAITSILIFIAIAITFNTIRLSIYASREEIGVMKLVGASNKYVRGPFVVSGIMYGLISSFITLIIFYPTVYYLGTITNNFSSDVNLVNYYIINFGQIFLIITGSGILLGAISSYLAVRRYLKV